MSKVLMVDDDANVLDAFRRQFRNRFELQTATGGKAGLQALTADPSFSVVVSDYHMPDINGVEFLSHVRQQFPETVCIMLTGKADLEVVMNAVNQNGIFRFLTKPCSLDILERTIKSGIAQYDLQQAEKEILTHTLTSCLDALTEILSLVNPEAFGRTSRIQRRAKRIAEELDLADDWNFDIASRLSQIGCISVPQKVISKFNKSEPLTQEERQVFFQYPSIGAGWIEQIPRLEKVADIMRLQEQPFSECPRVEQNSDLSEDFSICAHILKVAIDYDSLESSNFSHKEVLQILEGRPGQYNPVVLDAAKAAFIREKQYRLKTMLGHELEPDMILLEGIMDANGKLLVAKGQELTPMTIQHIRHLYQAKIIKQPIKVIIPV